MGWSCIWKLLLLNDLIWVERIGGGGWLPNIYPEWEPADKTSSCGRGFAKCPLRPDWCHQKCITCMCTLGQQIGMTLGHNNTWLVWLWKQIKGFTSLVILVMELRATRALEGSRTFYIEACNKKENLLYKDSVCLLVIYSQKPLFCCY